MEYYSFTLHSNALGFRNGNYCQGNVVPLVMPPVEEEEDEEKDSK